MANFCTNCGAPNADGTKFCTSCGNPLPEAAPVQEPVQQPAFEQQPVQQPVYAQQPVQQGYPQPQQGYPQQPQADYQPGYTGFSEAPKKNNSKTIIIVIVAILLIGGAIAALFLTGVIGGGGSGSSALVGTWEDEYGLSSYKFESDGDATISALGMDFEGTYKVEGDKLTITYEIMGYETSLDFTFEVNGDELTLNSSTSGTAVYKRK